MILLAACGQTLTTAPPTTVPPTQAPTPALLPSPTAVRVPTNIPATQASPPTNTPVPTVPPVVTAKFLMAFHACNTATSSKCNSPENHQVYLAQGDDGITWKMIPNWKPFKGSVPDVIRRGNTLYIYTASSNVVKYRIDTGATETARIKVNGLA